MKDLYKTVTIGERRFVIRKMTAMAGLQLARLLLAKALPIAPKLEEGLDVATIAQAVETVSDAELQTIVTKCLCVCAEDLPAGRAPVLDDAGHFGVEGVEYDMGLTLRLCAEAIKWSMGDFFGGSLSDLLRPEELGDMSR